MSNEVQDWLSGFFEMNPDAAEVEEVKKGKEHKLDLFKTVLPALDRRDFGFFDRLDADQKKEIVPWLLMRWMSSSSSAAEHHIMMVNDMVNRDFSVFAPRVTQGKAGHLGLQWRLLALCGTGRSQRHVWVAPPKGAIKNKLESAVLAIFPLMKDSDLELFLKVNTREELKELFIENGYDDKTLKDLFKE
jgi:hypothetical protein